MKHEQIMINDKANVTSYIIEGDEQIRSAIIICPGGGYLKVSSHEGECVALRFNNANYHAFVVEYSTYSNQPDKMQYPSQLIELANVVKLIREHANEWKIKSDQIHILGFSAGGNIAASYGNLWNSELLKAVSEQEELLRPTSILLAYPLLDYFMIMEKMETVKDLRVDLERVTSESKQIMNMTQLIEASNQCFLGNRRPNDDMLKKASPLYHIGAQTPPTFIWHTVEDELIPVRQVLTYVNILLDFEIPCELHIYEKGHHGLSLGDMSSSCKATNHDKSVQTWISLAILWLQNQIQ